MTDSLNHLEAVDTLQAVQQNLQQSALQLGQLHNTAAIRDLYDAAQGLLSHLAPDPLTVARVAGVLLVYQLPDTDLNEVQWFKSQRQNCPDVESVEELMAAPRFANGSLSRPDAL